ncbi:MAG: hypothetical protein ACOX4X_00755 [Aminobacterium colombiense]|uniref:hypothetical protein n=1 Tax=Aminobacterium colombiense TaxID=81468 RepID=UPI003D95806D
MEGLIAMAGGMTATGYKGRVQVMRVVVRNTATIFAGDVNAPLCTPVGSDHA